MADRKPIIAGNWKENMTHTDAIALVRTLSYELKEPDYERVDVVVCPPYTALRSVQLVLEDEYIPIALGAQNLFWEDEGAYTGEISGVFLNALHCSYVIVGHSERRKYFGETDETVNKRVIAAFRNKLTPIVCVGETLEEREGGQTEAVLERQVRDGLAGFTNDSRSAHSWSRTNPCGRSAPARQPRPRTRTRRSGSSARRSAAMSTDDVAQSVRIQYGGSVSAGNIAQLMTSRRSTVRSVGGASLEAKSFAMIVKF